MSSARPIASGFTALPAAPMARPVRLGDADAVVRVLAECIAALRQRDPDSVDVSRPFNELGVDSLDAMTLLGEVEERFGVVLDAAEIYEHPTPAALARAIALRSQAHAA